MDYGINDIDEYGCVKPGLGMILIAFFLSRQLFYGPVIALATRRSRASSGAEIDMSFLQIHSLWEFVACMPAIVVLVLIVTRKPESGEKTRLLWTHAKSLLIASAGMHLMLFGWELFASGFGNPGFLVITILNVYVLSYVMRSQRITDAVSQFPSKN